MGEDAKTESLLGAAAPPVGSAVPVSIASPAGARLETAPTPALPETSGGLSTPGASRLGSTRAQNRRRAAEDALLDALLLPRETAVESVGAEGQTLLMKALQRLERQDDIEGSVAWAVSSEGAPIVIAAQPADLASRIPPEPHLFRALTNLERVQRLTDSGLGRDLGTLAALGVGAAAPICGLAGMPSAVILVYPAKAGRPLRPRSIAILGEVASKLAKTLTTSMALDRMSALDGAVRRLDRMAALGGLVSEIVHEVRNPLVSVKTFLQLLPDRLEDSEFHHEFRLVVSDEVARLERMLDDLLRHARPAPAPVLDDEARISEAIETTLRLLTYRCRERGVILESEIRPELPALGLAQDALRQLLLNLLLNATEVSPEGGHIRVTADWSLDTVNHIEIRVSDDGPGLDEAMRTHLFEPFTTTRSAGPGGLGLAICKRIAEDAAGTIDVKNSRNGGACFRIILPIAG